MKVWSGTIDLSRESQLKGLQLIDPTSHWQSDISNGSNLSLRSFVNPSLIPLYARAGPNLELHTTDTKTSQWLKSKLLGNIWLQEEDLDRFQSIQCPVGLLIRVDNPARVKPSGPQTSDLLIYGVLSRAAAFERPPTPPVSSSPDCDDENPSHATNRELRIYATPLSTSLVTKAQALPSPPRNHDDAQFAEFLPDLRSPSPKRKRVASLFDSVAQHHKRVRQRGGEAVSQLMAPSSAQPSQQLQARRIKRESEEPSLPLLGRIASQRSRSLSLGGNLNPGKPLESRTEHPRPSSGRAHVRGLVSKRNTPAPFLEQSTRSERSPALPSSEGKSDEPSSTPKTPETIISDNKNIITRTILTCMRLYGFNRAGSRSGATNKGTPGINQDIEDAHSASLTAAASGTDEDEFKTMYHATYRASTFALRKYLKDAPLNADGSKALPPSLERAKAMTYIDEFLRLFCEEN